MHKPNTPPVRATQRATQISHIWIISSPDGTQPKSAPIGAYSRRRAKTEVAVRGGFSSASVLGWRSWGLRAHGMVRVLRYR
jgi:hypothetical protein